MFPSVLRPAIPGAANVTTRGATAALLRCGLLAGCVVAIGVAAWVGDPGVTLQADPALARLLRGMALIKGLMTIAAVSAVYWRFGWRVSRPAAATYLVAGGVMSGATALIWQLSFILPAALLFHAAALTLLWVGWRER
jgi:hypothetical protein